MRSLMIGMMGRVAWAAAWVAWAVVWAVAWAAAWAAWGAVCGPFLRPACRSPTLAPNQTRHLPTRLVSLSAPDPDEGLALPAAGEKLQILGDVAKVNDNPRVQKALRRLAAAKAPTSLSQLVMWRVAADLDWNTIAQLSRSWANRHETRSGPGFRRSSR